MKSKKHRNFGLLLVLLVSLCVGFVAWFFILHSLTQTERARIVRNTQAMYRLDAVQSLHREISEHERFLNAHGIRLDDFVVEQATLSSLKQMLRQYGSPSIPSEKLASIRHHSEQTLRIAILLEAALEALRATTHTKPGPAFNEKIRELLHSPPVTQSGSDRFETLMRGYREGDDALANMTWEDVPRERKIFLKQERRMLFNSVDE